jgi:cell division protein FtsN
MMGYRFVNKAPEAPKKVVPDPRIKKLEAELDELKSKKPEKDTVVLVQKVVERVPAPREAKVEKPKTEGKTGTPDKKPTKTTPDKIDGTPFYILVSGSFSEGAYALAYSNSLKAKGMSNDIHYNAANNTYYVHLGKYSDKERARNDIKGKFAGQKVWIKTIE